MWWTILLLAQTPPPYFAGIDSIGAKPLPQLPSPVLFFEAKAPWPALGIEEPRTAWEFAQRGMYRQDDLEDLPSAILDYEMAVLLNPHLLIAHARLGQIALNRARAPGDSTVRLAAIEDVLHHFDEVILEQPYRHGMHKKRGDAYAIRFEINGNAADAIAAESEYLEELQVSPNHQGCYYALAFLYRDLGRMTDARTAVARYLALTELHSDPYPYKILKARKLMEEL